MNEPTVIHGDCVEVMGSLPEASVEAVVTDPPYLINFMGKGWDSADGIAGKPEVWREALRVLKPGGHLLAFGGTRTWHRLAVAIEDAGFEIRDSIAWMYGSGFPKSLDVSKSIDKKRDDTEAIHAVVRWLEQRRQDAGVSRVEVERHFGTQNIGQALFTITPGSTSRVATWDQWQELKAMFKFDDSMDDEVWRLNGRKGKPGEAWDERRVVVEDIRHRSSTAWETKSGMLAAGLQDFSITAPATPAAQQWQGWGTALKPAFEPIVVARKPLDGTVAENVLRHGTGALNIDGSRIGTDAGWSYPNGAGGNGFHGGVGRPADGTRTEPVAATGGRWPANVILDESQAAELDRQSGVLTSGKVKPGTIRGKQSEASVAYADMAAGSELTGYGDTGGASRFFYVPKANKKERPRDGDTAHPTVKPLALMCYLVKLVTPPGGTVLDPFAGSGATVEAAMLEGFHVIGIELTPEYLPLIQQRIDRATEDMQGRLL